MRAAFPQCLQNKILRQKEKEWWFAPWYPGIFGAAVPPAQTGEVSWLSRAKFSCRQPTVSEIVKSDVGNQYWNGRTTGHYNGKSHLAWDLVFTILLSRAPTARADAKFGFLEAGTQSTIIVYSFVKIWDTCPKCWRMEMFENSQIKHFSTFIIVYNLHPGPHFVLKRSHHYRLSIKSGWADASTG